MSSTSTVIEPIAEAIAAKFATGLNLDGTPTLKGYWPDPGLAGLDVLPALVVGVPTVTRPDTTQWDEQDHIGQNDWNFRFPGALIFDLSEAVFSQKQAVEAMEAFIKAIDADPTLGQAGLVQQAVVTNADPVEADPSETRKLLIYPLTVAVLAFV